LELNCHAAAAADQEQIGIVQPAFIVVGDANAQRRSALTLMLPAVGADASVLAVLGASLVA
jgi:hypothetical protein